MDLGKLASALKRHRIAACYLMTNFQNPLGSSMPDEKNADLVKLLARNSVPVIEDYVYEELTSPPGGILAGTLPRRRASVARPRAAASVTSRVKPRPISRDRPARA
jgi:DNA-binding transcriptional MocR family regulator